MQTYNHDICGFIRRLDRYIYEMHKSVSSGVMAMNDFDKGRLMSYLGACHAYIDWIIAQPQLDLPESSPQVYTIDDPQELEVADNENCNDIIRLWEILRKELVNSQSSRNAAGIVSFDEGRIRALLNKIEAFKEMYIDQTSPMDMPESMPLRAMTGPGRTGV